MNTLNELSTGPIQGMRFDGEVVVVTGAGNGLGKSHAHYFASLGARVVVNDLGVDVSGSGAAQVSPADQVVSEIKALGGEACANYDSVVDGKHIITQAMDEYGRIDVLINNAGILRDKSFHKMTLDDWRQVQDVHLNGAFALCHAAWPHMRSQQYGRIIFTLSASGIYGNFGQANYSAAKMGMLGLMNTLAIEGKPKNIHANAIAPIVDSRMLQQFLPADVLQQLQPDKVSPLIALLCHRDCESTGELFEAGGGWFGKLRWQRSDGAFFTPLQTIDGNALAEHLQQICGFESAHYPADTVEAIGYLLNKLAGENNDQSIA